MKYRYRNESEMKDSGVEWIGKIPKDWETLKLKRITESVKNGIWGDDEKYNSDDIPCIRILNFERNKMQVNINDLTLRNIAKEKQKDYLLKKGDLLIEKSGGGEKNPVGFVAIYNHTLPSIYANFMAKISLSNKAYSSFVVYLCSDIYSKRIHMDSVNQTTGIQNLDIEKYFSRVIALPYIREQERIANFLDEKTSQFDLIISKKEELIKKLEEAKKSLISEVVTGKVKVVKTDDGYELVKRKSEEMKDSGVEWVKEIPIHWDVINGKRIFDQRKEKAQKGDEQLTASQKYGVIFQKDFMELENQKVVLVEKDFSILKHVEPNDFVISMRSFQGGLEYSQIRGCISSAYVMLIPNEKVYSPFFRWFFKSAKYINALQSTSNLVRDGQAMRYSNFTQIPLFIFSIEEQQELANYLYESIGNIERLMSKTKTQIEKLKEAKKSLISEAVTGKIEILD